MVTHLLPLNQQIAYLQIFITKYCCPVKVTFIRPPPLRGTPSLREASLSIFPKGARLEGELTRHSSVSRRKMSRRRLPL